MQMCTDADMPVILHGGTALQIAACWDMCAYVLGPTQMPGTHICRSNAVDSRSLPEIVDGVIQLQASK